MILCNNLPFWQPKCFPNYLSKSPRIWIACVVKKIFFKLHINTMWAYSYISIWHEILKRKIQIFVSILLNTFIIIE